jgi:hypothetical protein
VTVGDRDRLQADPRLRRQPVAKARTSSASAPRGTDSIISIETIASKDPPVREKSSSRTPMRSPSPRRLGHRVEAFDVSGSLDERERQLHQGVIG